MRGSSHIRSVLIGGKYRNCCRTLDVYLLFAIWNLDVANSKMLKRKNTNNNVKTALLKVKNVRMLKVLNSAQESRLDFFTFL